MLYWHFHFRNEIQVNLFFTDWKYTYVYIGPWRWSALNMGFVDNWPSRMQGKWFFWIWAEWAVVFGRVQKNLDFFMGADPARIYLPQGGGLTSPQHL